MPGSCKYEINREYDLWKKFSRKFQNGTTFKDIFSPEGLEEHNRQMAALQENKPIDDKNNFLFDNEYQKTIRMLSENPAATDAVIIALFDAFIKAFPLEWKRLRNLRHLLQGFIERGQIDDFKMFCQTCDDFILLKSSLNTQAARVAHKKNSLARNLEMRQYYEPIRQSSAPAGQKIIEFQKQFEIYWRENKGAVVKCSQKRSKRPLKRKKRGAEKAPHQNYPVEFEKFRTNYYRWEKMIFPEDTKQGLMDVIRKLYHANLPPDTPPS